MDYYKKENSPAKKKRYKTIEEEEIDEIEIDREIEMDEKVG
jgi:hypothetical protein